MAEHLPGMVAINASEGFAFRVWAPHARSVAVFGEFNDWSVEANFTENLDTPGQAGVYASRGYAALGRQVAFIGNLGNDACGALVREAFARDGVDVRGVFTDPAGTARSVNVMYPDGRRKNFYDARAASACCSPCSASR